MDKDPSKVTVKDIFNAVGEEITLTPCTAEGDARKDCDHEQKCLSHDMWVETADYINGYFSSITIHDILEKKSASVELENAIT